MSALSAPVTGISGREFARRERCDGKIIRRAIESGHLQTLADGSLDPALVGSGWRKSNRRAAAPADMGADKGEDKGAGSPHPVRTAPEATARSGRAPEDDDGADPIDADAFVAGVLAGRVYKLAESERVKEGALALKQVLAARQAAGELIEVGMAEAVLFETFRAARDSWLNWPSRVGPLIAVDLEMPPDRITEVLTAHVQAHLADLGEPDADFASRSD